MNDYAVAVQLWKSRQITNASELAAALNRFSVSFAYHSLKIENEQITFRDTREIFENDGAIASTGDLRTVLEIRNAKEAFKLFLKTFDDRRSVDESLIKEFQYTLAKDIYDARRVHLGERPGEYKHHDYITGKGETGAAPEDVAEEINELIAELHDLPRDGLLTGAAYFHVKFENIHPFADGNGRVGRLLMNYLLVLNDHPPIIIFEEDRQEYFGVLEKWDSAQELDPMITFLQEQAIKTWHKQIEIAKA